MCLCGGVKNRIVTCEKSMFGEKKDMSKLGRWVPNLPGSCKTHYCSALFLHKNSEMNNCSDQ